MNTRLPQLRQLLRQMKLDAVLLHQPNEICAFCGFAPLQSTLVVKANTIVLIVPEGTVPPAGAAIGSLEMREYAVYGFQRVENAHGNFAALVRECTADCHKIGISHPCPAGIFPVEKAVDLSGDIERFMLLKESAEIDGIRQALALNSAAFEAVRAHIRGGMTERDLYYLFGEVYLRHGCMEVMGDFLSGSRTLEISGSATDKPLQTGDTVILDCQPAWGGYYGDTTRTFFIGEPAPAACGAYQAVCGALAAGESMLRPGIACSKVYETVSEYLQSRGFAVLPHHAGHGVGFSRYEAPYLIPSCDMPLEPGMVIALEPGVYPPGQFGVRLENNYLITGDGPVNLCEYPLELEHFILTGPKDRE